MISVYVQVHIHTFIGHRYSKRPGVLADYHHRHQQGAAISGRRLDERGVRD